MHRSLRVERHVKTRESRMHVSARNLFPICSHNKPTVLQEQFCVKYEMQIFSATENTEGTEVGSQLSVISYQFLVFHYPFSTFRFPLSTCPRFPTRPQRRSPSRCGENPRRARALLWMTFS